MKLFAFVRRARRSPAPEDVAAPTEKRRRRPSSGSATWKPTLVAISEDAVMTSAAAAANKAQAKPAAAAAAKTKPRPSPRAARATSSYDDFRHYGPPMVLPAFTPTAFLF